MRRLPLFLLATIYYLLATSPTRAVTNPLTPDENTISATVLTGTSVSIPHLHSPQNGSVTNNLYQQFSWQRSTGGLMHYTFYFDDLVLADGITHEPSQNKTEWSAVVDSAYVYFTLKTPLPEGIHRWKVIAQGEIDVAASEIWSLTIDATPPVIILQAVDRNNMYWSTNDPSSIPPESERHLTVSTPDPLLVGKVEARSNLKFSHGNQTVTTTEMDGYWEQRFTDLLDGVIYTVYITATDTAGNTNSFPPFTIVYRPGAPVTLTPTVTPIPSVTTLPFPFVFPTVPPGDFFRQPPPPPAQPVAPTVSEPAPTPSVIPDLIGNLYPLILFGLLLHLAMTFYGAGIHLGHLPGFLFTLCFPFFGKKTYEVDPFFTTVTIFDPENLSKEFFSWVSNIKGKIFLNFPNPKQVFIQLTRPGYEKQSLLMATAAIPGTVLKLKPKDHPNPLERLKTFFITIRGLPLIIANLTSLVVLILQPSLPVAFYFSLAFTLTYSEYLYPRLK